MKLHGPSAEPYLDCVNYYLINLLNFVRMHPGPRRTLNYELSLLEFESMLDVLLMVGTAVDQVAVTQVVMLAVRFLKMSHYL